MSIKKRVTTFLNHHHHTLAQRWILQSHIRTTLSHYRIDTQQFIEEFASPIVQSFADILSGRQSIEDLSIRQKLIHFLFDKMVSIQDIFLLCIALRYTLFQLLEKEKILTSTHKESIKILSKIFDTNLSLLLESFEILSLQQSYQRESNQHSYQIQELQTILDMQKSLIFKVSHHQLSFANQTFYKAVNIKDIEQFHKRYPKVWGFIEKVSHLNRLFQAKEYAQWLQQLLIKHQGRCEATLFDHRQNHTILVQMEIQPLKEQEKESYIITLTDITQRKKELHTLTQIAYSDTLTGAPNRRVFQEKFQAALKSYQHDQKPFFLLIIDIHQLHEINTYLGREVGDAILKSFAELMMKNLSNKYFFARIDGERFALITYQSKLEEAQKSAQEVIKEIHTIFYTHTEHARANIAIIRPLEGDDLQSMMSRADTLIKQMKECRTHDISLFLDDSNLIEEEKLFSEIREKFLNECQHALTHETSLDVMNFYKEVPIQSDGKVIKVIGDTVWIQIRKVALHALNFNPELYIRRDKKPHIKAKVTDVNSDKLMVRIEEIVPLKESPLDRKNIHVRLNPSIETLLHYQNIQIPALLETISIDAASLKTDYIFNLQLSDTTTIHTIFRWDGKEVPLKLSGTVHKIIETNGSFKVVISLLHFKAIEETIAPFIAYRQIEIIRELQNALL
ncbi:MAG: hypothetical protein DSY46_01280 [Hydrogenimonas sp.]|nr:MAG: hypothetical protein DSY46_01280 [Hydrogenimonas sp.]